jgi:hypothetical protein
MIPDRFAWQRRCCAEVPGMILNAGCKEDPAQLKATWPGRVINLDRHDYDEDRLRATGERVPIRVDVLWDLTRRPWPFPDDQFGLVVFGDVLEDLPPGTQVDVLREGRRVARYVCITCPEDTPERDPHHLTAVTGELLKSWLEEAGWYPLEILRVAYGFVPTGWWVLACRPGLGPLTQYLGYAHLMPAVQAWLHGRLADADLAGVL